MVNVYILPYRRKSTKAARCGEKALAGHMPIGADRSQLFLSVENKHDLSLPKCRFDTSNRLYGLFRVCVKISNISRIVFGKYVHTFHAVYWSHRMLAASYR